MFNSSSFRDSLNDIRKEEVARYWLKFDDTFELVKELIIKIKYIDIVNIDNLKIILFF